MPSSYKDARFCGKYWCKFVGDQSMLEKSKAILIYGSNIKVENMPLPRLPKHMWALLHEESPRNVPFMPYVDVLKHFNYTATFSRFSDLPLTTQYLPNVGDLTNSTYLVPVQKKSANKAIAPIIFLQSNCDTMSGREDYVRELMDYIQIDSYGNCMHNRDLSKDLQKDYLNNLYSPQLYRLLGKYKFVLAFENGVCDDYITEKLWRALIVGSIPIYFGAPNIKDWVPNAKSVIFIDDFDSPKDLAEFIKNLNKNDVEYNEYLAHKYNRLHPIENLHLKQELATRVYSENGKSLFAAFECGVCQRLHQLDEFGSRVAHIKHYNCPLPLVYPKMRTKVKNDWNSIMSIGKCQAQLFDELMQLNESFTKAEWLSILNERVETGLCD
ncbi:alpha-(1,3)-fucosyltransferase B isoform X2 [Teleopsis dalmanni]|nr:alpha-(1,3)-fucosyltransferase B isoform X2 [Teleopsis dalmanni]